MKNVGDRTNTPNHLPCCHNMKCWPKSGFGLRPDVVPLARIWRECRLSSNLATLATAGFHAGDRRFFSRRAPLPAFADRHTAEYLDDARTCCGGGIVWQVVEW